MKKVMLLAAVAGMAALLQGCASSMSKSEYAVCITSEPMGQDFKVYNRKGEYVHQGKTPEIVVLKAQSDFFTREKYIIKNGPKEHKLEATYSPFYWGNVIMPPGFAVDGITGAMWALPDKTSLDKPQDMNQMNL